MERYPPVVDLVGARVAGDEAQSGPGRRSAAWVRVGPIMGPRASTVGTFNNFNERRRRAAPTKGLRTARQSRTVPTPTSPGWIFDSSETFDGPFAECFWRKRGRSPVPAEHTVHHPFASLARSARSALRQPRSDAYVQRRLHEAGVEQLLVTPPTEFQRFRLGRASEPQASRPAAETDMRRYWPKRRTCVHLVFILSYRRIFVP
jgi:hypothetical protein